MPESGIKTKSRPISDVIMDAGQHISEFEKSTVADSNKHVSKLLARSRSLDLLCSSSSGGPPRGDLTSLNDNNNKGDNSASLLTSYSPEERDCEQQNLYVANYITASSNSAESSPINTTSVKDASSSVVSSHKKDSTLLKEKSELNNNENCNNTSSRRSSSISTNSNCSSNSATATKINKKLQRRSTSSTTGGGGGTAYQEVVVNEPVRITGYLEKRSKVLGWKKFWFVLDGRLLTYYKSKADYESLSACCGCINLGIASSVRPIQIRGCKGYPLQIVTRSQVYYLRSQEKPVLEQWLIAIQEAASSPPSSSALTSWNSGSQYFRNSYASQSQWSLNNSSDDITDITERLGNLPDTFYQKRDSGSFASTSSQAPPVIHKYHSFASLQAPVVNNFGDLRKRVMLSSHENLRNLQTVPKENKGTIMQQSTSLLVLDSSPQAAELRKELTRKLSIGSSRKTSICSSNEDEDVPTPKFLLLTAKKKSEGVGVFGDEDSHHYDEIGEFEGVKNYENCDAEKFSASGSKSNNSVRGDSAEKDSNIYEHIETVDSAISGPQTGVIWEPLNEPNNSCNSKRLPHRLSAGSNRNSLVSISELPEDTASISPSPSKTPNLTSIPEACWKSGVEPYKNYSKPLSEDDLSSCRSESFRSLPCVEKAGNKKRKGKAFGGFFSKVFRKKGKGKSDSQENLQSSMVISGPVDLRRMHMSTEIQERKPSQKSNEQVTASPTLPGSRMTINNTIVLDELKQKVVELNLKRTNSNSDRSSSDSSPKEALQIIKTKPSSNVEARVPYVPRPGAAISQNKSLPVLVFQTQDKSLESSTDDDDFLLNEREKEIQVASISLSPDNETSSSEVDKLSQIGESPSMESPDIEELQDTVPPSVPIISHPLSSLSTTSRGKDSEDFQNKLAKFNRLSQSLSASFMAALTPSNTNTMHSQMGRSHSYKQHRNKIEDILPPLPPKKKNMLCGGTTGSVPSAIYDVPLNNRPVTLKPSSADNIQTEKSIAAYVRNLTKKNSTPDIVLSGNNSKPFFRDMLISDAKVRHKSLDNSDESIDVHKSNTSLPPARPPKPKLPAKPKSLDTDYIRTKRNSESSGSSETIVVSPSPRASQTHLDTSVKTSPATSNKSLDIDNLDALSDADLTETKASNSPQESPKLCPIHPENFTRADSVLSSVVAKTPESTVSDRFVPDSLASTPDTEIFLESESNTISGTESDTEPISINKLEIVIRDNDGSPGLTQKSPDNESRIDSLERNVKLNSIISSADSSGGIYQNLKFATVNTLIQEFETVEENEDEMSELYDDFPSEFYTPTPSSFSGYSPSDASTTSSSDSSQLPPAESSPAKKHIRIDSIRNSGMEQLEAFLSFGSNSSSDELSFESCTDSIADEGGNKPNNNVSQSTGSINNNSTSKVSASVAHFNAAASQSASSGGVNRVGAISRLGHSSAIGHLQKILTSDVK